MNSSDETQRNGVSSKENLPTNNRIAINPDTNANLNLSHDESKGAIPKRKLSKTGSKKFNNNVDDFASEMKPNTTKLPSTSTTNYLNNLPESDSPSNITEISSSSYIPVANGSHSFLETSNESNECAFLDINNSKKDSDSSSDDNELLSVSDDGCIYTYKGDHAADLPSSFFSLGIHPPVEDIWANNDAREENASSPEMDFLEMDFDPGPSGDADSNSDSNIEIDNTILPLDQTSNPEIPNSLPVRPFQPLQNSLPEINNCDNHTPAPQKVVTVDLAQATPKVEVKMPWHRPIAQRTRAAKNLRFCRRHRGPKGELNSPSELFATSPAMCVSGMVQMSDSLGTPEQTHLDGPCADIERIMLWSPRDAHLRQITQVGPSACGATAVLNVLNALRYPIPTLERLHECVKTRQRANAAPLAEYLLSRSSAGCSHRDLIAGLHTLSEGRLYARFFAMHPERVLHLEAWLAYWMAHGAVPIATLNIQMAEGERPDSWHHQMVFGVGPEGVFLTNPLECVPGEELWPQLAAEPVLLVRTEDVVARWNPRVDLPALMRIADARWRRMNVVGQVAKVIRESGRKARVDHVFRSHIRIPAEYRAGVTLVMEKSQPAFQLLRECPELPLLYDDASASAF